MGWSKYILKLQRCEDSCKTQQFIQSPATVINRIFPLSQRLSCPIQILAIIQALHVQTPRHRCSNHQGISKITRLHVRVAVTYIRGRVCISVSVCLCVCVIGREGGREREKERERGCGEPPCNLEFEPSYNCLYAIGPAFHILWPSSSSASSSASSCM